MPLLSYLAAAPTPHGPHRPAPRDNPRLHATTLGCSRPVHRRRFSSATADGADAGLAVKKVTSSNFEPALEELHVRVQGADFVTIDLEMTGITSAPWRDAFEFDRSDVRYLKVKDSAEKFTVVQCGVCPFRWDGAKGSFIAHPILEYFK